MSIDPQVLHAERHVEIGQIIESDAELLVERWQHRALIEQANAQGAHRQELRDQLPAFLRALGRHLAESQTGKPRPHCLLAVEHGEQRWKSGWSPAELVRDYQILRLVILDRLDELLDRPLEFREAMAIGLSLDEAVAAATVTYAAWREDQLREVDRRKTEFLANMSHEIRTPMTAILGFTEVMLAEGGDAGHREMLETVQRNGLFLLEIVNDILDMSKIEAGKTELEPAPCSVRKLVEEVVALLDQRAREKQLRLDVQFAADLPEAILTDGTRLRQILVNLAANAVKFTDRGEVRIVAGYAAGNGRLTIEVGDTGRGMDAEQAQRIFEPFAQLAQSDGRSAEGTGLGLTISKRLAVLLGGDIAVESRSGAGSTFRVTIVAPAVAAPAPEAESRRHPLAPADADALRGCRLLVADDRRDSRLLISRMLEKAGAIVEVVADGERAVGAVADAEQRGEPFHVILLDMRMPLVDGYEAAARIRAAGCRTPIVALTASGMEGDREKCLAAGCDDYVVKPIHHRELTELVARHGVRR